METKVLQIVNELITRDNMLIVVAVYALLQLFPKKWLKIGRRQHNLKPVVSTLLCVGAKYALVCCGDEPIHHGYVIIVGIILGNAVGHAHGFLKSTIFGEPPPVEVDLKTGKRLVTKQQLLVEQVKKVLT